MPTQQRRTAFTLIELLVVISIISLLMAILLPALGQARRSSYKIQCGSNLRQLQIAHAAYTVDNQEIIIPSELYGLGSNAWAMTGWITSDTAVTFGLNNGHYFPGRWPLLTRCPENPLEPLVLGVPTQYMANRNISTNQINHPTLGSSRKVVKTTEITRQPSRLISIADAGDDTATVTLYSWYPFGTPGTVVKANHYTEYRVNETGYWHLSSTANVVALDGHVATVTLADAQPSAPANITWWQHFELANLSYAKN